MWISFLLVLGDAFAIRTDLSFASSQRLILPWCFNTMSESFVARPASGNAEKYSDLQSGSPLATLAWHGSTAVLENVARTFFGLGLP